MILLIGKARIGRGFLLLEIMLSISILSIGILLILNSFIRPIRAMEISRDYFKAGLMLEEKLLDLYNSYIEDGLSRGEFIDFGGRFSWYMDVIKSEYDSCREVILKVIWREKDQEKSLSISTYI